MRGKLALLAACLALVGPAIARADLPITGVSPTSISFVPGGTSVITFTGTVTNNSGAALDSGNASLTPSPGLVDATTDASVFALNFGPLADGAAYTGDLFTLTINPGQKDPFSIAFDVTGLDPNGDPLRDATGSLVVSAVAVPEPGVVSLLVSGMMVGGAFLRRRRK